MIFNKKQLELGFAGLALLRNRLVGNDDIAKNIIEEIARISNYKTSPPSPVESKVAEYNVSDGYEAWSKIYDNIPNLLIQVEEPEVKSLLKEFKKGKAIDVACGTGRFSEILSSLGHEVTGVDSSPHMLKLAKAKVPKAKFIQARLEKLPIESESVDLAICALALTHLSTLSKSLGELNRVIRKGGSIILSDIHPFFVIVGGQAEFQDAKGKLGYIFNNTHLHGQYLQEFNKLGLKVKQCKEITLDSKYIDPKEIGLNLSKSTMEIALKDLPLVLIWVLEKTV